MLDFVISDKTLANDTAAAIAAAGAIANVGYLFHENTLQCVLSDLVNIRQLQTAVNERLDSERTFAALLMQNLAAGFPIDLIRPMFAGKLADERIEQLVTQYREGNFKVTQSGLNAVKTATVRDSDKPSRSSLDWSKVQDYMVANGINPKLWADGNLAKANGSFASFRRIAREILAGNTISNKDRAILLDGPKTRGDDSA